MATIGWDDFAKVDVRVPPKRIAGFVSEVLVLGVMVEDDDVVLLHPDREVPLGRRIA